MSDHRNLTERTSDAKGWARKFSVRDFVGANERELAVLIGQFMKTKDPTKGQLHQIENVMTTLAQNLRLRIK